MDKTTSGYFSFDEMYSKVADANLYEKHMHNHYELYYYLEGDANYIVGNTVYCLQPHDLLFIRPSVYHYLKLLSDAPYRRIVVHFSDAHLDGTVLNSLDKIQTHYRIPSDSLTNRYFTESIKLSTRYDGADKLNCSINFLNLILTELKYGSEFTDKEPPAIIHPVFDKILAYIDENLDAPLKIEDIASEFFVSPSWIMHSFRRFLDISAKEYINRKKVLKAQQLIAKGTSASDAAERCGYQSYPSFFIQYKKTLGMSPLDSKMKNARNMR